MVHPRKKQAVKKTNKAATIALIKRNAHHSPLVSLPAEVRQKILFYLVGGNVVHVKYRDPERIELVEHNDGFRMRGKYNGLQHAICVASLFEQQVYEQVRLSGVAAASKYSSIADYDERAAERLLEPAIPSFQGRHSHCKLSATETETKTVQDHEKSALLIDLSILRTCRQLYEEANYLLWDTNTFSFDCPNSFHLFEQTMTTAQKKDLRSLHLSFDSRWEKLARSVIRTRNNLWQKYLPKQTVKSFRGLRTLHLCFDHHLIPVTKNITNDGDATVYNLSRHNDDTDPFLRVRLLDLKTVTVVLSDHGADDVPCGVAPHFRWCTNDKRWYAEEIRAQLLDPNGAAILQAEVDARMKGVGFTLGEN